MTQPDSPRGEVKSLDAWTKWTVERPTDPKANYRWRIPARMICGMMLSPEWTSRLAFCGMGHADGEWWPESSHWDGYVRTVHPELEWRPALDDEAGVLWGGLNLLPDPWTGHLPKVVGKTRWIAAPAYEVESFSLSCRFGTSYGWSDLNELVAAWNGRAALKATERSDG